jgi:uncharacterized protein (DUF1330 family)
MSTKQPEKIDLRRRQFLEVATITVPALLAGIFPQLSLGQTSSDRPGSTPTNHQRSKNVKTYLINHLRIPGDIPNSHALDYLEKVEATVAPYGGKWLAMGPVDTQEGTWPGAVVLMEFPDRKSITTWYNSPEYQAIFPLRKNNSISDLIFIDQLPEGFTVKGYAQTVRHSLATK